MATEEKINSEEQLQEENITTQTEETQQTAEKQDAAKNSAEDAAGTPEVEIDPLEAAQAEIAELKKQILYKVAEFDNYRKRVIKEKADLILNGGEKVITAILPVVDDM
jgi:molecular chaperone GrpE